MEHMTDILGFFSVGSMAGIFTDMKVAMAAIVAILLVICGLGILSKILTMNYHGEDYHGRGSDTTWIKHKMEENRLDKYSDYKDSDSSGDLHKWRLKED
jgi:hypothetical protein